MTGVKVRYLEERKLRDGSITYIYNPPRYARDAGFRSMTLGKDVSVAITKAEEMNRRLDEWREAPRENKDDKRAAVVRQNTLGWLVQNYLASTQFKRTKVSSQSWYRRVLNTLSKVQYQAPGRVKPSYLFDYSLDDLDAAFADDLYYHLCKYEDGKPTTVSAANASMRALRRAMNVAIRRGEFTRANPFAKLAMTPEDERETVWQPDYIDRFIDAAYACGKPQVAIAMMLAYNLGQRINDTLTIRWDDIRHGKYQDRSQKTDTPVNIPLSDRLITALQDWPRKSEYIIVTDKWGTPYTTDGFRCLFRTVRDHAGLPKDVQFRDTRRTVATQLADAGATEDEILAVGGWKTRQIAARYVRRTSERAGNAIDKLSAYRLRKTPKKEAAE